MSRVLPTYAEASLALDLGRSLRDLGEPAPATRLITQAIDGFDPWQVCSRCFAQTDLAAAHLIGRDYEHAAAIARDAIRTATQLSSTSQSTGYAPCNGGSTPCAKTHPT